MIEKMKPVKKRTTRKAAPKPAMPVQEITDWRDGRVIFRGAYETFAKALEAAVRAKASLVGASLDGARLEYARLDEARLDGARLDEARLDGARLDGASLVGASLVGASLVGASLVGARLENARLDGARLDGARLVGAYFTQAQVNAFLGNPTLGEFLKRIGACSPAVDWFDEQKTDDIAVLWQRCHNADWMRWILERIPCAPRVPVDVSMEEIRRIVPVPYMPWLKKTEAKP